MYQLFSNGLKTSVMSSKDESVDRGYAMRSLSEATVQRGWIKFDGRYEKLFYDVLTPDGQIIERCWPNGGFISATSGKNQKWGPGECRIRPTLRGESRYRHS